MQSSCGNPVRCDGVSREKLTECASCPASLSTDRTSIGTFSSRRMRIHSFSEDRQGKVRSQAFHSRNSGRRYRGKGMNDFSRPYSRLKEFQNLFYRNPGPSHTHFALKHFRSLVEVIPQCRREIGKFHALTILHTGFGAKSPLNARLTFGVRVQSFSPNSSHGRSTGKAVTPPWKRRASRRS